MMRWRVCLATVRTAQALYGQAYARGLWSKLGLPSPEGVSASGRRSPYELVRDTIAAMDKGEGVRRGDLNHKTTQILGVAREAALEALERDGLIRRQQVRAKGVHAHERIWFIGGSQESGS